MFGFGEKLSHWFLPYETIIPLCLLSRPGIISVSLDFEGNFCPAEEENLVFIGRGALRTQGWAPRGPRTTLENHTSQGPLRTQVWAPMGPRATLENHTSAGQKFLRNSEGAR